jgi:hypothetical protein
VQNPLRSEDAAFRLLVMAVIAGAVIAGLLLLVRALS